MAEFARERGGTLIVDEIYHGLVYEGDCTTALAFADDVFVINSFSKYFNMTGWRLGWMVAPERYVPAIEKLAQNIYLAPPTPAQHAALAAFEPETLAILEARRAEFRARRDYLVPALREIGFDIPVTPQGAFYVYAGCAGLTRDSFGFARDLLEEAGRRDHAGCGLRGERAGAARALRVHELDRAVEGRRGRHRGVPEAQESSAPRVLE